MRFPQPTECLEIYCPVSRVKADVSHRAVTRPATIGKIVDHTHFDLSRWHGAQSGYLASGLGGAIYAEHRDIRCIHNLILLKLKKKKLQQKEKKEW